MREMPHRFEGFAAYPPSPCSPTVSVQTAKAFSREAEPPRSKNPTQNSTFTDTKTDRPMAGTAGKLLGE